jgi:hypothetical protein
VKPVMRPTVEVRAVDTSGLPPEAARRLERLSTLLDRAITIPGTRIGVGLDPILGLIPGIGDAATGALSLWIIVEAARMGAPRATLIRMLANVAVDTFGGSLPLVGDVFDFAWRSNSRNMDLLRGHIGAPVQAKRASKLTVAAIVAGVLLLIALGIAASVWLIRGVMGMLGG